MGAGPTDRCSRQLGIKIEIGVIVIAVVGRGDGDASQHSIKRSLTIAVRRHNDGCSPGRHAVDGGEGHAVDDSAGCQIGERDGVTISHIWVAGCDFCINNAIKGKGSVFCAFHTIVTPFVNNWCRVRLAVAQIDREIPFD